MDDRATTPHEPAAAFDGVDLGYDQVEVGDELAQLATESLERRQADLEICDVLALAGFRGPAWEKYACELARYGCAVMMAWLVTGEIFKLCKSKGRNLGSPPVDWTSDDRMELANDTVAVALNNFKQALITGKWTVDGGATLKTYFTGACILAFPNLYRKWLTKHAVLQRLTSIENDTAENLDPAQDPAEIVVTRLRIKEGFDSIPDCRTKSVILLQEMGYSYVEIGEILKISPRAVDGLLQRQHERGARKRGGACHG